MVRSPAAADESLAAILARIKFGIAIAAMIRMIATTISSSISEKPFCLRISIFPLVCLGSNFILVTNDAVVTIFALASPKPLVTLVWRARSGSALFSMKSELQYQHPAVRLHGAGKMCVWQ